MYEHIKLYLELIKDFSDLSPNDLRIYIENELGKNDLFFQGIFEYGINPNDLVRGNTLDQKMRHAISTAKISRAKDAAHNSGVSVSKGNVLPREEPFKTIGKPYTLGRFASMRERMAAYHDVNLTAKGK